MELESRLHIGDSMCFDEQSGQEELIHVKVDVKHPSFYPLYAGVPDPFQHRSNS